MFEDFVANVESSDRRGRYKQLQRLVTRHAELRQFQALVKRANLTPKQKKDLERPANRKKLLRAIRKGLQKRSLPEETFEVWHKDLESHDEGFEAQMLELIDTIGSDEDLGSGSEDEDYVDGKLDSYERADDISNSLYKASFLVKKMGLEQLPESPYATVAQKRLETPQSIRRKHIGNLKVLLHMSILRKKWLLAYKIFCLVIRIPSVDIRALWPLGVEILAQQRQQRQNVPNAVAFSKEERFYEWLLAFATTNKSFDKDKEATRLRTSSAPAFRTSSRSHTALHVITSLWMLMAKNAIHEVVEKIQDLVLQPPYDSEGVLYFILAMCSMSLAIKLADRFIFFDERDEFEDDDDFDLAALDLKEHIRQLYNEHVQQVNHFLQTCEKLGYVYPHDFVEGELNELLAKMEESGRHKEYFLSSSSSGNELVLRVLPEKQDAEESDESALFAQEDGSNGAGRWDFLDDFSIVQEGEEMVLDFNSASPEKLSSQQGGDEAFSQINSKLLNFNEDLDDDVENLLDVSDSD